MTRTLFLLILISILTVIVPAQANTFTYQGKLTDGGNPANGTYLMQFSLFDASSGGTQIGPTLTFDGSLGPPAVQVTNGIFSVPLDFGVPTPPFDNTPRFDGSPRWLQIAARKIGDVTYTPLSPRQPITSEPYAIRSSSAANADTAANSTQLGGLAAAQYVTTTDPRMTDARTPIPGSANYIQNGTATQALSNFKISGTGSAGIFDAATQYNLNGFRFLSADSSNNNLFVGQGAGNFNSTGFQNTFVGQEAGLTNQGGSGNTYFGSAAGENNQAGNSNSFFGSSAGQSNNGGSNSFFGAQSGWKNLGGGGNTFVGLLSGQTNTNGGSNTLVGALADVASANLTNASAFGTEATVSQSNSLVLGSINGINGATADTNVGIGTTAPTQRLHVVGNQLITGDLTVGGTINGNFSGTIATASNALNLGGIAANQYVVTTDPRMTDARTPIAGSSNYIQNGTAAQTSSNFNISGTGTAAIFNATTQFNLNGNPFIKGGASGIALGNGTGVIGNSSNTFLGADTGFLISSGQGNTFVGNSAGINDTVGNTNTFVGVNSGLSNTSGADNSLFGRNSDVTGNVSNATAIGSRAEVTQNNSLVLGSINGVNGAGADTKVGIGTTAPSSKLHVNNGDIRVTGGSVLIANPGTVIITSPNGACWGITVNNSGALSTFPVSPCP